MTFPTSDTHRSLAVALQQAQSQASSIKRICQNNSSAMAAGNVASDFIIALYDNLSGAKTVFQQSAAVTGIAAYAQAQIGDSNLDIVAEFTAMVGAITSAMAWIEANFPKDANGFLLAQTFDGAGGRTQRQFTSTQTVGLRTALAAVVAAIGWGPRPMRLM